MIKKVAVIFGGRSCEHEISIITALQVMNALKEKYHIIPIYISKNGEFYSDAKYMNIAMYQKDPDFLKKKDRVYLNREDQEVYCVKNWFKKEVIDFVIPVLHGTNGEDGAIQGFLEILNVPYCGCSHLSAALAQSKTMSKKIMEYHHLSTLPYKKVTSIETEIPFLPCIIKPDRLGSSIGIGIVDNENEWQKKVGEALLYDDVCLVEPYIKDFREINASFMRVNDEIQYSHLEEVLKEDEILSFKDKYSSKGTKESAKRILNPQINEKIAQTIIELGKKAYACFEFDGVVRIDFMVIDEKVYVNEINTIPGSYAHYLWKEKGMLLLLEECMQEGMKRYRKKITKISSFDSDVLFHYKKGKKLK